MTTTCVNHKQKGDGQMGYGRTSWNYGSHKKTIALHRAVYCKAHGITPPEIDGKVVMHTCDNPRCINPAHLVLGTHKDNMKDMVDKGRSADVSGMSNPNRTLSESDVLEIRKLYEGGGWTYAALGRKYGVGYNTISRIIKRKLWSHI